MTRPRVYFPGTMWPFWEFARPILEPVVDIVVEPERVFTADELGPILAGVDGAILTAFEKLPRSVIEARSACMSCSHEIAAYDNVPLVSWVLLRGRCRHCASAIPLRYPLVELVTALLVSGCALRFGLVERLLESGSYLAADLVREALARVGE